jgi:hypothetical protein
MSRRLSLSLPVLQALNRPPVLLIVHRLPFRTISFRTILYRGASSRGICVYPKVICAGTAACRTRSSK